MSSSREQSSQFKDPSQSGSSGAASPRTTTSEDLKAGNLKGQTSGEILLHRPRRPAKPEPKTPSPEPVVEVPTSNGTEVSSQASQQPIPPPSEPMQYRAIGLVRGMYQPSEEQFNRGTLVTEDGTHLDAVLLGQVMSLVKKYLDLEQPYLWVVYPRTRDKQETLHIQIVGVWSDEGFGADEEEQDVENQSTSNGTPGLAAPLQDGYFSIRGQVVFQSVEKKFVLVKIQQAPRKSSDRPKDFKLKLLGTLEGSAIGYFWDLQVQRQGNALAISSGTSVAMVPLKKRKRSGSPLPKKRAERSDRSKPASPKKGPPRVIERPIKRQARSSGNE